MYNLKTSWHHINRTNKNGYLIILLVMQMKGLFILHQIAFKGGIIFPTFSLNCFPHSSFPLKGKQLRQKTSSDNLPLGCNQSTFENITSQKRKNVLKCYSFKDTIVLRILFIPSKRNWYFPPTRNLIIIKKIFGMHRT